MTKQVENKVKDNSALWIFPNFKETIDELPLKHQGEAWRIIIKYSFEGEKSVEKELEKCNKMVKMAFFSLKPLIKLRKKAGSQNGKSNNISGLSKPSEPNIGANIGANIDQILGYSFNNNNNNINTKQEIRKEIEDKKNPTLEDLKLWCTHLVTINKINNEYIEIVNRWLDYVSTTGILNKKYKTTQSFSVFMQNLYENSKKCPNVAKGMVDKSIKLGWEDVYKLDYNEETGLLPHNTYR